MSDRIFALLFSFVLACGLVAAQESPALLPKNAIRLSKVEGRMDHMSVDIKASGERNSWPAK